MVRIVFDCAYRDGRAGMEKTILKPLNRSRLTILGVAALFLAPVLIALYLNSAWTDWSPSTTRNQGILLTPATLIPGQEPRSNWLILQDARGGCDDTCITQLTLLRQVERALGRRADTAGRAVLLDRSDPAADRLKSEFPNLRYFYSGGTVANTLDQLGPDQLKIPDNQEARTFLIDPQNYLVMGYPAPVEGSAVRKDLNQLIKWADDS